MQVPVGLTEKREVYPGYTDSFGIKRRAGRIHQSAAFDDQIVLIWAKSIPSISPNSNGYIVLCQVQHILCTITLKTADKPDIGSQPRPLLIIDCLRLVMVEIIAFVDHNDPARAEMRQL